jgi:flagellar hook assembly protein FlgD
MWALVNWDNGPEGSEQITWIGTNSDGTTLGSNSVQSTTIASIFGAPTTLTVSDAATGTLEVTRSSAGTIINGNYIVRMYY